MTFSSREIATLLEVEWYERSNCNGWDVFFRLRTDKQTLVLARRVSTRYLLSAATLDSAIPRERLSRKDKACLPVMIAESSKSPARYCKR